jgi:transcriptional antiterminator RfaH
MLFPSYAFVVIELQWSGARWAPGVVRLVMDGGTPAKVPDPVIAEIKARERGGLVVLPRRSPRPGDAMQILQGPFRGHLALYAGQAPRERIAVLLALLGGQYRVELPSSDVEAVASD